MTDKSWHSMNFIRGEFACKCHCGKNTVDYGLVCLLDDIHGALREKLERKIRITVTSGNRCESHHRAIYRDLGMKPNMGSFHLDGKAADIKAEIKLEEGGWIAVDPEIVQEVAESFNPGGLGRYSTFTHVDVRDGKARWNG